MNILAKTRYTTRLHLEPINEGLADELWELFQDEGVAKRYVEKWSKPDGVHKELAFDKTSKEIISRGGLYLSA